LFSSDAAAMPAMKMAKWSSSQFTASAIHTPGDATPEEKAHREAKWHRYNDEISSMLNEKFGIS